MCFGFFWGIPSVQRVAITEFYLRNFRFGTELPFCVWIPEWGSDRLVPGDFYKETIRKLCICIEWNKSRERLGTVCSIQGSEDFYSLPTLLFHERNLKEKESRLLKRKEKKTKTFSFFRFSSFFVLKISPPPLFVLPLTPLCCFQIHFIH